MRSLTAVISVAFVGLLVWGVKAGVKAQTPNPQATVDREPVVVELFTSEGCSSCPPADALLAELDSRQPLRSAEIIAIEEHVDYWDQDGWMDPFSSAGWTARQNEYSDVLRTGSSYTPEMVVDGSAGFVGGRRAFAVQEIEKAAKPKKAKVEISGVSLKENKSVALKVSVEELSSSPSKDQTEVLLAITESGLHSSVGAGENSGKELRHSPVLRELRVIGVIGKNGQEPFTAQTAVKLDSKWNVANLRAVVFVQEKKSRRILGAATVRLAP
jgi:hypothetical protein